MRVAILGAGFAGLSVCWYLLHYKQGAIKIDLYDPQPIGGGASGISSGLLHTFSGRKAHLSWKASECMKEAHRLLTEASQGANESVVLTKGIVRPALSLSQESDFQSRAYAHPLELEWWDSADCLKKCPGLTLPSSSGALFIKNGLTIDAKKYLEGLWQTCSKHGVQFFQISDIDMSQLEGYDKVIVAIGPLTNSFPGMESLPLTGVKGQVIDLVWPQSVTPPPYTLVSQKHLVMSRDRKQCTVGATYEHEFSSLAPEPEIAAAQIIPSISSLYPELEKAKILGVRAGVRATTPSRLPLAGALNEKYYYFSGLGSKGLLYHGFVGKQLARAIISSDARHLPLECSGL